eukprot:751506-Hanusia_phi.AAC.3
MQLDLQQQPGQPQTHQQPPQGQQALAQAQRQYPGGAAGNPGVMPGNMQGKREKRGSGIERRAGRQPVQQARPGGVPMTQGRRRLTTLEEADRLAACNGEVERSGPREGSEGDSGKANLQAAKKRSRTSESVARYARVARRLRGFQCSEVHKLNFREPESLSPIPGPAVAPPVDPYDQIRADRLRLAGLTVRSPGRGRAAGVPGPGTPPGIGLYPGPGTPGSDSSTTPGPAPGGRGRSVSLGQADDDCPTSLSESATD